MRITNRSDELPTGYDDGCSIRICAASELHAPTWTCYWSHSSNLRNLIGIALARYKEALSIAGIASQGQLHSRQVSFHFCFHSLFNGLYLPRRHEVLDHFCCRISLDGDSRLRAGFCLGPM